METQRNETLLLSTPENRVQLAKAQFCQALEEMFGVEFELWLRVLKRLEAKGSIKPGPFLDALRELVADLEKLLQQRGSRHG